jgi:hypothetical protein
MKNLPPPPVVSIKKEEPKINNEDISMFNLAAQGVIRITE